MATYRFPIAVMEDVAGGFTAATLADPVYQSAVADTAPDAIHQLKDYLEWHCKKAPWMGPPDFMDPQVIIFKVEIRPEYTLELEPTIRFSERRAARRTRTFASSDPVTLRLPCVTGRDSSGLLLCVLPTLNARFTYLEDDSLKTLVITTAQNQLKGATPQRLARFLPPRSVTLDRILVQVDQDASGAARPEEAVPALSAVAEPLDGRGVRRQLSRPWERDEQVARLVEALIKDKASVILVGEPGSGKTAVIAEAVRKAGRGAAQQAQDDSAGDNAAGSDRRRRRYWLSSAARLIAGMQYLGQWQERCEAIIAELQMIGGTLCIENLLELVRVGGRGAGDSLAAFLAPYIQRNELQLIGEATPAELDACRRLLPGFADLFRIHIIPPFTRQQAAAALSHVTAAQKQQLRVDIDAGTVELLVRLFGRFMPYHGFPGRASSFLVQVFDRAHRDREECVSHRHIIAQLVRQTGLPERLLRDEIPLSRDDVLKELRSQVMGQETAIAAAADVIVTFKAGLNDPTRPLGVMLFCGPTGVGKTELAKSISKYLFGHGDTADRLIRLDMSEYAGPGAAERLLGDPRGDPSAFVQQVRQQPFGVVLLDEIEKAAPEVFDVLLGLLDEGRLTDTYGRLTSFRSSIIIMTSNLGAAVSEGFGLTSSRPAIADSAANYDADVMRYFRPEFYNRIDAVVPFNPLSEATMRQIVEKELAGIAAREGLTRSRLRLIWTQPVVDRMIATGFDRRYGARPLQRMLESAVVVPLSRYLLDNPALRDAEILLDLADDGAVQIA